MGFLIITATFLGMEGIAWFTHKYIMHGLFWHLHADHHVKPADHGVFERNDSFFLLFATPSIGLFAYWSISGMMWPLYVAIGIALYGMAYFLVHDIFIHQRIKLFTRSNNIYLRAIRKAHKIHHKHLTKYNGECFGMLLVPLRYFIEARKSR